MKKLADYTIKELEQMGAIIDVSFHNSKDIDEADDKMKQLGIKDVQYKKSGTYRWLIYKFGKIEVTSFFSDTE